MDDDHDTAAARRGDRLARLLVESITDYAIYMLDPEGYVVSWNSGAQRFKGYEAAEILGEHFSRFYTEKDRAVGLPAEALRIAAAEERFEREGWRVRKDGERFWAHVVIDPIRAPNGELLGFAKITRDLTERRASEEALRWSEEQFRLLVQGVTDYAIFLLDADGRVSNWNAGAERIEGYRPQEIIGQHLSRFYTEEDRAAGAPEQALRTAVDEGKFETEGWRVRSDGSRFWAHVVMDPIRDAAGELIGFAKITRDITERRAAQRALDEAREALFQSQKLEAIGQLTGGVAHDFNNLLMAIVGSLELLRKRLPYDARAEALLDNAMQGAQRGATLTQRLLSFARRQELKPQAVDLRDLIDGMLGLLERSLGPLVSIDVRIAEALPPVMTDPVQLETAILNLVVNGRDAMPEGGTITISAEPATIGPHSETGLAAGSYIRLSVADTGEGMNADALARAAEPFFTTKGLGKGTGLGLPMVHGLALQSGGRLDLASQPGAGAVITVTLPAAATDVRARRAPTEREDTRSGRLAPLVVLAVDDDSLVLMNTVAMLEDLGHRALEAMSAEEALEVLRRERVDLVVTDYAMPQTTGAQLADAIRAAHPGLPVILATGYAELPADADCTLPRLAKPFLQRDLAAAVQLVMGA
jgi:PAS domain S-box-containing protein